MKKTLIALALAALPVASMADVILYGQVKGGVETVFAKKDGGQKEKKDKTTTQIVDYGSRIGFKGHEHLNGDLKAIWQVEQKVSIGGDSRTKIHGVKTSQYGFSTRDSFVGLQGGFGTVKAGYLQTPVSDLNGKLDQWEYSNDEAGLAHFTRDTDASRRATAISYTTPDMGGFNATAYVSPSDNNHHSGDFGGKLHDNAIYGVGLSYAQPNGGFFADLAGTYVKNGPANANPRKSKSYQALAQRASAVDKDYDIVNEAALSGAYQVDDALRLKATAAYGWGINEHGGQKKAFGNGKYYQGLVGADYALSKRTVLNAQAGYRQFGKKDEKTSGGIVGVGMSHKF